MTNLRSWLTGARLLAVIAALALSTGTVFAWQPDDKFRPDDEATEPASDSDQPGLISESEYESPQFGVGIEWTDAWKVGDPDHPDVVYAIGGNYDGPVASDPELGDIIFLQDTASETAVLSLGFSPSEGPVDPELMAQAMAQEEFLTDNLFLSEDAEVLLVDSNETTAAVVAREAAPNDDHIVYMQIVADPGREDYSFWVGLDMYEPEEYEAILTSIENDIDVEDHETFDVFGTDDILEALAAEPEETPEASPTAEASPVATEESTAVATPVIIDPPGTPEDDATPVPADDATPEGALPGVVGEGEYVSPQHGVEITWTDTWVLDEDATPAPAVSVEGSGLDILYLTDAETEEAIVYLSVENQQPVFDPAQAEAALSSPDYIEGVLGLSPETEVAAVESTETGIGLVYVDESGATPFVSILELRVIDEDTVAYVEVRADADVIDEDLLDAVEDDIQIDGDDALDILSATDILNALP